MEKDFVFKGKVKNTGPFDFKEFYKFLYEWLLHKEYWVVEREYTEKQAQNGKEIVVKWDASRRISDYFRFMFKIEFRLFGIKKVEVEYEGKKMELDKGLMELHFQCILEKDYEQRWETSPFMKWLRTTYDRYVIRARIEDYEDRIFEEADEFLGQAKAFLAHSGIH